MDVLITIDTEVEPCQPDWRETGLRTDIQREVYGETSQGAFGIGYQAQMLNAYGLKAVFFVEALFACEVGIEPLREIVSVIQEAGHEVQLHLHAEWLSWIERSPLPGRTGYNLREFTLEEQALLIKTGLANLCAAGARDLCAFRAGNYGADFNTLAALARNGIAYDTSYNAAYLDSDCCLASESIMLQPAELHGVWEFPIAWFRDYPGHLRHAQLCACSFDELRAAMLSAWKQGWMAFVLVSHSFELLRRRKRRAVSPGPDRIVIKRFERLCEFLAENRDKFQTRGFAELNRDDFAVAGAQRALSSRIHRTVGRMAEQLFRRTMSA